MIDPSAVTLSENSYDEIIDAVEKQCVTNLEDVDKNIEVDKQELKDADEAYEEIPWYETAGYKAWDGVTTALDYLDWALHGIGKGCKGTGLAAMGTGGTIMLVGGEAEIATVGIGTPVVATGEVAGGVIVLGGGVVYLIGNVMYIATDGSLGDGGGSYDRAKNSKDSQKSSAKQKAGSDSSSLGETASDANISSSSKIDNKVLKQLKRMGLDKKFTNAMNKGMAPRRQGTSGIVRLTENEIITKGGHTYTFKLKVPTAGGHTRVYGYINEAGELIFDLITKG